MSGEEKSFSYKHMDKKSSDVIMKEVCQPNQK